MTDLMNYWLLKSEPDTFSITDLAKRPKQTAPWDGVRNYQARNMIRDQMQVGDQAFFYHSSCKVPGVVGIVEIVRASYPDATAFDPQSPYYDLKNTAVKPRWYCVDVKLMCQFKRVITLQELRQNPALKELLLLRPSNRLSVMPVSKEHWEIILLSE
jgi:predicted RNA-binding protein with PUA-like domain